jgi:hypothetical protein
MFNNTALSPVITITDNVGGSIYQLRENIDFVINHQSNVYFNAGEYEIRLTFTGNYSGFNIPKTFNIRPVEIILDTDRGVLSTVRVFSYDGYYPALPVIADVPGFRFVGWTYLGVPVDTEGGTDGLKTYGVHHLRALWQLTAPQVGGVSLVEGGYNHQASITLTPTVSHEFADVTYSFIWLYSNTGPDGFLPTGITGASFGGISDVSQSGWYRVIVTAHIEGENPSEGIVFEFEVIINRKQMSSSNIEVEAMHYTGSELRPTVFITDTVSGITYHLREGIDFVRVAGAPLINAGDHALRFNFIGNYIGENIEATFRILPYEITFANLKDTVVAGRFFSTATGLYPVLPVLDDITGFEFAGWAFGEVFVEGGDPIRAFANHNLSAVWTLLAPDVSAADINIVFDGLVHTIVAQVSHVAADMIRGYSYVWRLGNTVINDESALLEVLNVSDSGDYTLTVML